MNPIPALPLRQIKETSLYVADLTRSLHFYQQLLGLPVISREEGRHVFLRAGQSVLLLFNAARTRQDASLQLTFTESYWRSKFYNPCDQSQSTDTEVTPGTMTLRYRIYREAGNNGPPHWVLQLTNPDGSSFTYFRR